MRSLLKWGLLTLLMMVGVSIESVRADEPATGPAKGSISGVVMYGGQPVNGAMVRLVKPQRGQVGQAEAPQPQTAEQGKPAKPGKGNKAARAAGKAQPVATATTDDNGKFTFNDVAPGDYAVAVALRGQAVGRARVHVAAGQAASVSIQMRERPAGARKVQL